MSKIVFYWHSMSSASPVASALAELGVPHDRVKVDITTGEQHHPEFLAVNPNGKVPTLTVDGAPMFEALAIEMWLGERYGVKTGLWPQAGTPAHRQAVSWSTWAHVTYGAQFSRLHAANEMGTPQDAHGTAAHKALDQLLALLDTRLNLAQSLTAGPLTKSASGGCSGEVLGLKCLRRQVAVHHDRIDARLIKSAIEAGLMTNKCQKVSIFDDLHCHRSWGH
jgi:glutathione S-transferase